MPSGVMSRTATNFFGKDQAGTFTPPPLAKYQGSGDIYKGALDTATGGRNLVATERSAGMQRFDPARYREALLAGLRAKTDAGVRRGVSQAVDAGISRGLGSSDITTGQEAQARMAGEAAFAQGAAEAEGAVTDATLAENADRRRGAGALAETALANDQFGAKYGLDLKQLDEAARQNDNAALYGGALDVYTGRVGREQRKQERAGSIFQAGAKTAGTVLSTAAMV